MMFDSHVQSVAAAVCIVICPFLNIINVTDFLFATKLSLPLLLLPSLLFQTLGRVWQYKAKPRWLAYCTSNAAYTRIILHHTPTHLCSFLSHTHPITHLRARFQRNKAQSFCHTVSLARHCAVEGEEPGVKKKVVYGKKKPQPKPKPAEADAQLASASSGAAAAAETQAAAEASIAAAQAQAEVAKAQAQQAEEAQKQQEAEVPASDLPCAV